MKRTVSVVLACLFFGVAVVLAQSLPAPGAEHKKLDYLVGAWSREADLPRSPMGGGGKFRSTDQAEWMDGGYFVVMHSDSTMPFGPVKGLAVFGYSFDEKKYTYTAFNSLGDAETALGTINGDEWTWLNETRRGDMMMTRRFTVKILSPASYTFKYEMSMDGTHWSAIMDGKATKK